MRGVRLEARDVLLDATASRSTAKGRDLSSVPVPSGGEIRYISETWHWHRIISSYRKIGREESASGEAGPRRSTQESSPESCAFGGSSASAGEKLDSNLLFSGFAREDSGETGVRWENEEEDSGTLTLVENPPQPKRKMEALIRKKTFFRKDPFPPLFSNPNIYYQKSISLSTIIISFLLFSKEVRVALFEKGLDGLPVIFTFQAGLLALGFKI